MAVSAGDTDYTVKFPFLLLEPDSLICVLHEGMLRKLKVKFVIYLSLVATGGIAFDLSGHNNIALSNGVGLDGEKEKKKKILINSINH